MHFASLTGGTRSFADFLTPKTHSRFIFAGEVAKMRLILMSTVFAVAASIALAADKPDLSGNWKMDVSKSDFGASPAPDSFRRAIEHKEPALSMTDAQTSAFGDDTTVRKYTTDGKETTYHWMGNDIVSAAHWEENVLVIVGKLNSGGAEVVVTSRLTLSSDGKTLTESDKIVAGASELAQFKIVLVKQ